MLTRFGSIPLTDPISRRDIVKSKERERERETRVEIFPVFVIDEEKRLDYFNEREGRNVSIA